MCSRGLPPGQHSQLRFCDVYWALTDSCEPGFLDVARELPGERGGTHRCRNTGLACTGAAADCRTQLCIVSLVDEFLNSTVLNSAESTVVVEGKDKQ
jgi:hypothetical protein